MFKYPLLFYPKSIVQLEENSNKFKIWKNLIGSFNQPKEAVIISIDTLKKLERRQLISGYAEILKYSLISEKSFFLVFYKKMEKILKLDKNTVIKAIKISCDIKSKVVEMDEKERGIREILNFGHTFGHAIESLQVFQKDFSWRSSNFRNVLSLKVFKLHWYL